MENLKYDIESEYDEVVAKVSEKYKYNEDLKKVLRKILPAMLEGCSYEERLVFYKMLTHTPIVVFQKNSKPTEEELINTYIGNVNPHIQEEEINMGEYGKQAAAGGFVSEAILDENLNIVGTKQFVYVGSIDLEKSYSDSDKKRYELLGSGINVSHLIHELGHAWVSEKGQYKIQDGYLIQRCGTSEFKYTFIPNGEGKYIKKGLSTEGLMLEEALNTNQEVESMARYLGITKEELCEELYKSNGCFIPSDYQGVMSGITEYLLETPLKKELRDWRINGNKDSLNKINSVMSRTKAYQSRNNENQYEKIKNDIFEKPDGDRMKKFFENCRKDFFPDKMSMTPVQILENSLTQCYDMSVNKFCFDFFSEKSMEKYSGILQAAMAQGYLLINDTIELLRDEKEEQKQES